MTQKVAHKKIIKNFLRWKKAGIITCISILAFFLLLGIYYETSKKHLPQNLMIGEVSVAGMNEQEFHDFFREHRLQYGPVTVTYNNQHTTLDITEEVYKNFVDTLWTQIYLKTNNKNWMLFAWSRIRAIFKQQNIAPQELTIDSFNELDIQYLYDVYELHPVYQGKVAYASNKIIIEPSIAGAFISSEEFIDDLTTVLLSSKKHNFALPVDDVQPLSSEHDIEMLVKKLEELLETPRTIRHERVVDREYSLSSDDIKNMLTLSYNFSTEQFVLGFDDAQLDIFAENFSAQNAFIGLTDDYYVKIYKEHSGVHIDKEELRKRIRDGFNSDDDTEVWVLKKGLIELPKQTVDEYNHYHLKHLVSEFTTYHGCCAARVENIHRIADMLDNTLIKPGETLNINEFIGERTREKGFKDAGSIMKGELVDSVGGGISQFITTLHNAVYWGGYDIVAHKPHSIYFSRYPKGVEATINWPYVDYIFRNDTTSNIMIDTEYTDTSITVRILGDNADRVFIGDHRGKTWKNLVRNSDEARKVISYVSLPYNYREPLVRYINDSSIPSGQQIIERRGGQGWSVLVERKVSLKGEIIHHDKKPVHYLSDKDTLIRVNPCDNPSEFYSYCYQQ